MKIGKTLHMLQLAALVMAGSAFFSAPALADVDVASAKIERLGPDPRFASTSSGYMVQFSDTAANPAWAGVRQFYLSDDLGNTGIATLLTAFSLDETVWVRIAGTAEAGSLVTIIFVNAPAP